MLVGSGLWNLEVSGLGTALGKTSKSSSARGHRDMPTASETQGLRAGSTESSGRHACEGHAKSQLMCDRRKVLFRSCQVEMAVRSSHRASKSRLMKNLGAGPGKEMKQTEPATHIKTVNYSGLRESRGQKHQDATSESMLMSG